MEQNVNHRPAHRNRLAKSHRGRISAKPKRNNVSRVTNDPRTLLPLNPIAVQRRQRDLFDAYVSDLGGWDNITTSELAILRVAIPMQVELEKRATIFAQVGQVDDTALSIYSTTSKTLRGHLEALSPNLQRRSRDVNPAVPTLDQYLRNRHQAPDPSEVVE